MLLVLGCNPARPEFTNNSIAPEPAANSIALQPTGNSTGPEPVANPVTAPTSGDGTIALGDISDEPAKKMEELQPLADYLALRLQHHGINQGRVIIARDVEEMARFLREGNVDVYFDSPFPTLRVQKLADTRIILRRWKQQDPAYWSVYVVRRDSGIKSIEGFAGKALAVEEPNSTSGFILPIGTLLQRGFKVREVPRPTASVAPDEIGYFFSRDEENTFELVRRGQAAGGGVSNQDYDELPLELKQELMAFGPTITVPRQLVSVSIVLDSQLVGQIQELLAELHQAEEGRQILESLDKTRKFDRLPPESASALAQLEVLMELVQQD